MITYGYDDRGGGGGRNNINILQCPAARGGASLRELSLPKKIAQRSNKIIVNALTEALCCLNVRVDLKDSGKVTFEDDTNVMNAGKDYINRLDAFRNINSFEEAYIMTLSKICNQINYYREGRNVGEQDCRDSEDCVRDAIKDIPLGHVINSRYLPFNSASSATFAWDNFIWVGISMFYFLF